MLTLLALTVLLTEKPGDAFSIAAAGSAAVGNSVGGFCSIFWAGCIVGFIVVHAKIPSFESKFRISCVISATDLLSVDIV